MNVSTELANANDTIKSLECKQAEMVKSLESQVQAVAVVSKERDDLKAELVKAQAENIKSIEAAVVEAKAHEATKKELEAAKAALANPAFAAAAAQGSKTAVVEGGAEAVKVMTFAEAHAEYKAIEDPKQRAQYRKDHAAELKLN